MWYVIQTLTGREEELARMVKRILPGDIYSDCFVAYYERVWRKQQQSLVHIERLFPGYVFILADEPEEIFRYLRRVPAMSKLISDGMFTFLPLEEGEAAFLERMLDDAHIVRLSYVEKDGRGSVRRITGPLQSCMGQVARYQYKKRYALVNVRILGKMKQVALGIILPEDVRQELAYGRIEAPLPLPAHYQAGTAAAEAELAVGDRVTVMSGTLMGMTGIVRKVKKSTVDIGVRLFGQEMPVEVPSAAVCKGV